ncbi:MAG: hypothetical protein NC131_02580 [Roseburia sp.]|nr:hypothetical protein [Roseburia sp.]
MLPWQSYRGKADFVIRDYHVAHKLAPHNDKHSKMQITFPRGFAARVLSLHAVSNAFVPLDNVSHNVAAGLGGLRRVAFSACVSVRLGRGRGFFSVACRRNAAKQF